MPCLPISRAIKKFHDEASAHNTPELYTDNAPHVAAREYPGCFTINQVRQRLGQPTTPDPPEDPPGVEGNIPTVENHFLPTCVCSPLHAECDPEHGEDTKSQTVRTILDQLRESAELGCWFCVVVYGGIVAAPPWDPVLEDKLPEKNPPTISLSTYRSPDFTITAFADWDKQRTNEPRVTFYFDEDEVATPPCKLLRCRKEPNYGDPHEQMAFISKRLQNCLQGHSCVPLAPPAMPTRLFHVRVQDGRYALRLVEGVTVSPPRPYLSLSHCWGTSFPIHAKTTASNLDLRRSCIPWADLTQTFRDAVAMTERLGFEYVWIDALCIIQDSSSDWELEFSRMCDVYSSCALLLSADASPDSNVGFFRSSTISTRPWRPALPAAWRNHGIKVHYEKVHTTYGKMPAMYQPASQHSHIFPLDTRAWCYQESRLPRRVVHFGVDEISWDCTGDEAECQCNNRRLGLLNGLYNGLETEFTAKQKFRSWQSTVTMYSIRELSFWTDRLPAISGLAKQFMAVKKSGDVTGPDAATTETKQRFEEIDLGTYLAGIWSRFVFEGLCWYADYSPGRRLNTKSSYVAPSWSWASVSGEVHFSGDDDDGSVEVVSACCYPTGPDETGKVSGGEIVLRARTIPVKLFWGQWVHKAISFRSHPRTFEYQQVEIRDAETGERHDPGMYFPDGVEPKAGVEFMALSTFKLEQESLTPILDGDYFVLPIAQLFILVVRAVREEGPNVYERMGVIKPVKNYTGWGTADATFTVREMPKGIFEAVEPQIVRLV